MNNDNIYNAKILVVDDSNDNLELIEDYLDDEGYENIICVLSAKEAYEELEKNKIDLIILDIIMPEIGGLEACKHIKSQERYKDIPIIFATAKSDMQTLKDGFDAGANDYVRKPITNEVELTSRVKNALHLKYNIDQCRNAYVALDDQLKKEIKLREQIEIEKEIIQKQEIQIMESAKMAQMGEMIGNIAHQWRQPLSVISTAASGMLVSKEWDALNDDRFQEYCQAIVKNTEYLSTTIDTFRDFIKEKKERKDVILQDRINNAINIISSSLENNRIQLLNNINNDFPIKINMVVPRVKFLGIGKDILM